MTDRRRINGPLSGTQAPRFAFSVENPSPHPQRKRKPNELRKIFLKTGLIPAAAGSAYLELEAQSDASRVSFVSTTSSLKLTCTINCPKPVSRTSSFSPNLQLTAHVKFAPFATRQRRGYLRDSIERNLGVHLETALRGVVIADRWPKSAIDVVVTVLEGEEDYETAYTQGSKNGVEEAAMMTVLAGCITVASAALADAKIDCLDLVAGGVAATVLDANGDLIRILDPCPAEHDSMTSACVVSYLPARDEITEIWVKGDLTLKSSSMDVGLEELVDSAIAAAKGSQLILKDAVKESAERWMQTSKSSGGIKSKEATAITDEAMKI